MRKFTLLSIISICIILMAFNLPQAEKKQELTAKEIVQKMLDLTQGNVNYSEFTMSVIREKWTRTYSMKSWMKGTDKSLIVITAPAKEQGQAFLKVGSEMWNWIPNIGRMVKLPTSMMSSSWMGSDFSNDDLVNQSSIITDFEHKILGQETIENYPCWKIELKAKPESAIIWGKIISYIAKDKYFILKQEFYDEDDELVNTEIQSDIKEMSGRLIPTFMEITPTDKPNQKTTLRIEKSDFNISLEDDFFSIQNMKRVR